MTTARSDGLGRSESAALHSLLFPSGALPLVYEVLRLRKFTTVFGATTPAAAATLAAVFVGLTTGSAFLGARMARFHRPLRVYGLLEIGAGLSALLVEPLLLAFDWGLPALHEHLNGAPLLTEHVIRTRQKSTGQALGWLLAVNIAGVVAGSFLAAFVLPKLMGLWVTIFAVGLLMIVVGELSSGGLARLGPRRFVVGGLVILCAVVWNPAQLPRTKVRAIRGETLVDLHEGSHRIVAVVDQSGSRRLKLDNFYVLGGTGSTGDGRMQPHIPLLLHPAPKRVVFLGLGTGITAGAALLHPIERVTAIEMVTDFDLV